MKQNKKISIICLLLSLLVLFVACTPSDAPESSSAEESSSSSASVDESKEAEGWVAGLEDIGERYAGREFVIVTANAALFASDGQNLLGKAVNKRRQLVSEKYGISIVVKEKSVSDITKGLREAKANGTRYADLVCAPGDMLASLAEEGLLENLQTLPCVDYNAGYMPKAEIAEQTVGQTMYTFTGSLTMAANECMAVFYNKKALAGLGYDPIELVNNGAWTWSALNSIAEELAKGGNGGVFTTLDDEELAIAVYNSSGAKLLSADDGALKPGYDVTAAEYTKKIMQNLFGNREIAPLRDAERIYDGFSSGNIGMFVGKIGDIVNFENAKQEWGLLPMPKHSETQTKHYTPMSATAAAVAVPINNGDSAFVGTVLNALFAATADSLESALKLTYVNYYFWSNDAAVMLYRVCDSKIYDMGNIYSRILAVAKVGKNPLISTGTVNVSEADLAEFESFSKKLFVRYK